MDANPIAGWKSRETLIVELAPMFSGRWNADNTDRTDKDIKESVKNCFICVIRVQQKNQEKKCENT